jgi:hypothetical protein
MAGGAAFTIAEMMVSMAASVIVLGGLFLSTLSVQKALHGSEKFAGAYSDQRRLIDFIGRDLRRAVALAATDAAGNRREVSNSTVRIDGLASLILTLPGYYRSNVKTAADFDQPLEIVGTEERLDYGTPTGLAPTLEVVFRKIPVAQEGTVCFVREEAGVREVIVRKAAEIQAEVNVRADAQSSSIKVWFQAPYSKNAPVISSYDRLMLRNPPLALRP